MKQTKRAATSIVALFASAGFAVALFLLHNGPTILLASGPGPDVHVSDRYRKANITKVEPQAVLKHLLG